MDKLPDALRSALGPALRPALRPDRFGPVYPSAPRILTTHDFTQASVPAGYNFTSSGGKTYFKADGLMYTSAANEWPLEFDPVTHAVLGRSIWEARQNVCKYSADLTNAAWVKTSCTAALTQTNLFGVANAASTLTATAANATCKQTITLTATAVPSIYLKRITGTGTVNISRDGGTTLVPVTLTSNWQRFFIASASVTNPVFTIQIVTSGDAIGVCGAQMETLAFSGACAYAGPLIPTTSAFVTRQAETCVFTGLSTLAFNASQGTLALHGIAPAALNLTSFDHIASLSDGTGNNTIRLYLAAAAAAHVIYASGGVVQSNVAPGSAAFGAPVTLACSWSPNNVASALNGAAAVTASVFTVPPFTQIELGNQTGTAGRGWNGIISKLVYGSYQVPNATLPTL
jgi:hypothetical protein